MFLPAVVSRKLFTVFVGSLLYRPLTSVLKIIEKLYITSKNKTLSPVISEYRVTWGKMR